VAGELTDPSLRAGARCPELELLLRCARADAVNADRAGMPVQETMAWASLTDAAEYHGLAPILYRALNSAGLGQIPENVAARLRDCYGHSARRNGILTARLLTLLSAFGAGGIAVVPLKGPVLAESLYPDPVLRPFSDLDLLVRKQDVPAAVQLLTREGYTFGAHLARLPFDTLVSFTFELLFRHEQMAQVDLQWDTGPSDYPFRFDVEILWRSLSRAQIARKEVATLSPESLLLYLCVHGTKHMWSRLVWLGDVARLARAQPGWVRIFELATEAGCTRPLLLGLLLAYEVLAAPVPEAILERARAAPAVQAAARQVVLRLNRIAPAEPESLEITAFNARLAERTWHKVRHYAALFKAPTEAELELVLLPPKLFFLYYPLRAARLASKYIFR
jgi:hypothetical protein